MSEELDRQDPETTSVPIGDLDFATRNPKLHPDRNADVVRSSIQQYGQIEPLIVQRSSMRMISGNLRLKLFREEGYDEIDVAILDVNDAEADHLAVLLNRSAELGEWDASVLDEMLSELGDEDVDLDGLFSEEEADEILSGLANELGDLGLEEEDEPKEKKKRTPKSGEFVDFTVPMKVADRAFMYDALRAAQKDLDLPNSAQALLAIVRTYRERAEEAA